LLCTPQFERGVPVVLDGGRMGLVALLERAAEIGARHGAVIEDWTNGSSISVQCGPLGLA